MTKGSSSKPKTLGRLIFGEKRKQNASPSRHRSASRNPTNSADISASSSKTTNPSNKNAINLHDWAVWRMQLNEEMASSHSERLDPKLMRQYLQSNQFYQQHSRDPSTGRHNASRLLFSIPHTKMKSEFIDRPQTYNTSDMPQVPTHFPAEPRATVDATLASLLSKSPSAKTSDFIRKHESTSVLDIQKPRIASRPAYSACDRIHSTLQKSVKDGNVLEKIKAFEMQAAAAQAESSSKLIGTSLSHRVHPVTNVHPSGAQRALSPPAKFPIHQQAISPLPVSQPMNQRSHRSRHIHPTEHVRGVPNGLSGNVKDLKKGAHVLEPALGDIILKRRTPSQRTINEDDYSTTIMSTVAAAPSHQHSHHHRQSNHHSHQYRRASASRSRVRHEQTHETRKTTHKEKNHHKAQSKQKEPANKPETCTSPAEGSNPTKTSGSRYRWLRGRKETPPDVHTEDSKTEVTEKKSKKDSKNKKKKMEKTKSESKDKEKSSDNNRVYGVPNLASSEEAKADAEPSIMETDREPEPYSQRESKGDGFDEKNIYTTPKDDESMGDRVNNEIVSAVEIERRPNANKNCHQKLSSTDVDILDKVDDENRFSRPTDDHACHSELNDDDEECKSEGDVFIEEPIIKASPKPLRPQQASIRIVRSLSSHTPNEKFGVERRWHWSKESGGLIDKGNRTKVSSTSQLSAISFSPINKNSDQDKFDEDSSMISPCHSSVSQMRPSFHISTINEQESDKYDLEPTIDTNQQEIYNIKEDQEKFSNDRPQSTSITDEFFDKGPHTNPEENLAKLTLSSEEKKGKREH